MSWRVHHPPREELTALLDGELKPEHSMRLEAHVDVCAECADIVSAYRRYDDTLRIAFGVAASGDDRAPRPLHCERNRLRYTLPRRVAAVVAVILILLGGGAAMWLERTGERPTEVAMLGRAAIDAYRSVHEEIGGIEADELSRWASEAVGRQVRVPDLRQRGYRLVGKDLQTTDGEVGAIVVFEGGQARRIVCYFTQWRGTGESPLQYQREDGVAAVYRADSHVGYAVAGNVDRSELLAVAKSAYPPDD